MGNGFKESFFHMSDNTNRYLFSLRQEINDANTFCMLIDPCMRYLVMYTSQQLVKEKAPITSTELWKFIGMMLI